MKHLIIYTLIIFSACKQVKNRRTENINLGDSLQSKTIAKTVDNSWFYTNQDTLTITTQNCDTLNYTKTEFNEIVDNFPALYSSNPDDPDLTFRTNNQFKDFKDEKGNSKHISFSSEKGEDVYYILYSYFLQKRYNLNKYETQRQTLTKIYNKINSINKDLNFGGTYFAHQYSRIIGYAEYSIYLYSKNQNLYDRTYDISKQKNIYINSLRQFVKDELTVDSRFNKGIISSENKKKLEIELYKTIDEISCLITNSFYLKNAQSFQYSHY